MKPSGDFWEAIGALNGNFNNLGFAIIGVFIAAWVLSYEIFEAKRRDEFEIGTNGWS